MKKAYAGLWKKDGSLVVKTQDQVEGRKNYQIYKLKKDALDNCWHQGCEVKRVFIFTKEELEAFRKECREKPE